MAADLVHIIHPDLPNAPASVQARAAFERTFKEKGWVALSAEDAAKHNQAVADGKPSPSLPKPAKATQPGGEG